MKASLDTTFQRVDDGAVIWINIDLPDAAALRQRLIPDSERETTVPKSVFDFSWMNDIAPRTEDRPVLFIAAGVLCYFEASQVESLFRKLAGVYPSSQFVFDAMSRFTVWWSNREILKKTGMDVSALLKWHLKKASRLKKRLDSVEIVEEYPLFSRIPIKEDMNRKLVRDIKIAGRLRLYNMVHLRFG